MDSAQHPEGETPRDRERREKAERAVRQEKRATQAIEAIMGGANLTAESLALANEFTDETTERLKKKFGRKG